MLLVVTGVGWLIHIYSTGYMAHEGGYYRFFSYLNLFMFFMLILVLAANYVLLFVGWEGVRLSSYLLIVFYFLPKPPPAPRKQAFTSTRHRLLRRHHRPGADRHQSRSRLLPRQPARLHVPRLRRRRIFRRHLPPHDPRLLQSPALPRFRQRHSRHGRRARHAAHGRPEQKNSLDLSHHAHCHAGHHRLPSPGRFLQQRLHPAQRLPERARRPHPLRLRPADGAAHFLLHVPAHLPHFSRQAAL